MQALLKLFTAAAIAVGIVFYVTQGDIEQAVEAGERAYTEAMDRKAERVAAVAAAKAIEEAGPQEPERVATPVVVREARAEPLSTFLKMTGATEAGRNVEVRAETGGLVAIAPSRGTRVREGDLLCRMDIGDRNARRAALIARYNQAKTEEAAQEQLSQRGFAARNTATARATEAETVRAEVAQLDIDIKRLEIRAPFDGVVDEAPVEIGSLLSMGGLCASIVDPNPLKLSGYAPETKVAQLSRGMKATAKLATGQTVQGRISRIDVTADPSTRTFEVEIAVPNPDYSLRAEVTAEIEIELSPQSAILIPQSSLTLDAEGKIGVMVVERDTARFREVSILRNDGSGAWVEGLGDAARVIVVGQEFVSTGTEVETTLQIGDILGAGGGA